MNSLFFVVCIVAVVCTAGVIKEYLKTRAKKEERGVDADETYAQMEILEERVRVLECIVTESKIDLRREIDKL
jgi:hypothetical protein